MTRYFLSLVTIAALAAMAASAQARAPRGLEDLVDVRAASGERELKDRGYRHYKTTKIRDSSIAYWWNSRKGSCIAATTRDGRYASIVDQPDKMCGEDQDSSRGHHRDRDGSEYDLVGMKAGKGERELKDRGYKKRGTADFGGGAIAYWWKPRQERCIAVNTKNGRFSSVVDQPDRMCRDDRGRSGGHRGDRYGTPSDVVGMRTGEGEEALRDRGYQQRTAFGTGGNSPMAYWWEPREKRCIGVKEQYGRLYAVVDQPKTMCGK